jgi:ArsR family metal-binding transcriptional regulator
MFVNKIEITETMPCLADTEKIRFIARIEKDVSEVFPYLNTILKGAIYNHNARTLTLKKQGRLITLHPNKIAAGKVIDDEDARRIIDWLKECMNDCYEKKDSLVPTYERREKLTALDIFKLLPGTNCKRCGELTCLAFAVHLSGEEASIMKCAELFLAGYSDKRNELLRVLKSSGYDVPSVFVEKS